MKKLILTLAVIAAVSAPHAFSRNIAWRAVDANSSWDEIVRSGLKVKWPTVGIANAGFAVGGLCVDGDNVRPLQPYGRYCAEYVGGGAVTCGRYEDLYYSTPRTYTYTACARWVDEGESARCAGYHTGTATIPLSYEIEVFKVTDAGESLAEEKVFTKSFDIPGCSK